MKTRWSKKTIQRNNKVVSKEIHCDVACEGIVKENWIITSVDNVGSPVEQIETIKFRALALRRSNDGLTLLIIQLHLEYH